MQCAPARTTATCDGRSHGSAVWLGVRQQGRWASGSRPQRSLFLVGAAEDPAELGSDEDPSRVLRRSPRHPWTLGLDSYCRTRTGVGSEARCYPPLTAGPGPSRCLAGVSWLVWVAVVFVLVRAARVVFWCMT